MLFTSLPFVLFFVLFFLLYWFVFNKSLKLQNILILAGSYLFYAWWDWRFLFLLIGSSLLNYMLGIGIYRNKEGRFQKILMCVGLLQGLGCLFFFKYYHFFINTFAAAFSAKPDTGDLHILLPLGISFYTFRTISYLLDIKNGKIAPATDWVVFFSYVSFFPCVISGPIDRPGLLIPQLEKKRIFDYARACDGMRQILWGVFKKVIIADNCAGFTSDIFDHYKTLPASSLLLGAFLSIIQVYADFSGYSDMAIGMSNLLGIKITRNFNMPFFAQNIADFWRRWHISLTSWVTDYIFTPLAISFRDFAKAGLIGAILINFTVIGIWHGPNWTFVLFGFLNGCCYIPLILTGKFQKKEKLPPRGSTLPFIMLIRMAGTFMLIMFTFIIFRSESLSQALDYYRRLFSASVFSMPVVVEKINMLVTLVCIAIMFFVEWVQREKQHVLQIDEIRSFYLKALIYYSLILVILSFSATKHVDFVYFKF